jgi:hypothetical protein
MYAPYPENMMESIKKVEATRAQRMATEPRRLTAEEKDALLEKFHPDYNPDAFAEIKVGPNKGQKAPLELAEMLHSTSRLINEKIDLTKIDYDVDVLVIGGGGAGSSCAIEAHNAGADVMIVTKLRIGDANTMMAEGGIQAADKENDSPVQHYLDCFGGGHFAAKPEESGSETSPWQLSWKDDGAYTTWLTAMKERSAVESDVTVTCSDKVLTLSTCTPGGTGRFLVMGKLVKVDNEI